MQTVLIVIHLMVVLALVFVVLIQRSEGGGLGVGGGSGGFMTGRGQTNLLTRTTAILAAAFFATSMALTVLAGYSGKPTSVFDKAPAPASAPASPADPAAPGSLLDQLGGGQPAPATPAPATAPAPAAPAPAAPATPATPTP